MYLKGIPLPDARKIGPGRYTTKDKVMLFEAVAELLARGVRTASMLARLIGVGPDTATRYKKAVEAQWAEAYKGGLVDIRRERLYQEAEAVASFAWRRALEESNSSRVVASLLKLVLQANERRAKLCGLDQQKVKVESTSKVESTVQVDVVASVAEEFGLDRDALSAIGREAAIRISHQKLAEMALSHALPAPCTSDVQGVYKECTPTPPTPELDSLEAANLDAAEEADRALREWQRTQEATTPGASEMAAAGEWDEE